MNRISIKNLQKKVKINSRKLKVLADKVLTHHKINDAELSVLLVDDAKIAELNGQYLNKNSATDVLAFRMPDGKYGQVNPQVLGDVVLSAETARKKAAQLKLDTDREIYLYLVHGILHLLGFTDKTEKGFRQMKRLQEEMLNKYA